MATVRVPSEQVTRLLDLLTVVAAAADTGDDDRYELLYCRSQVGEEVPEIEALVLAGVLAEMTHRPGPDPAARDACRWWSAQLALLVRAASATGPGAWSLRSAA